MVWKYNGQFDGIEQVAVLTTDIPGQMQWKFHPVGKIGDLTAAKRFEDLFNGGGTFDSSSLRGLNTIDKSDMTTRVDPNGFAAKDPFIKVPTLLAFGEMREPETVGGKNYHKDPRAVAKRAEDFLKSTGIGDTAYFSPEIEFFIFNSVTVKAEPHNQILSYGSSEGAWESGIHNIPNKRGYFPVAAWDKTVEVRSQIMKTMEQMGIECEAHHHEVATAGQAEINMHFDTLTRMADKTQLYKYVSRSIARQANMEAVFLPKPMPNDNGSGMHVNTSIWKNGQNIFAGSEYGGLTKDGIHAVGGALHHIKALSGLANPTTNSSRRFAKGFEAPILAVYGARNRSAAIRIPSYHTNPKVKRLELRFPDPTANPYLLFAGIVMAMIDGIQKKILPGEPMEHDVYEMSPEEQKKLIVIPRTLDARLDALNNDRDFLLNGGVFNNEILDAFIAQATEYASEVEKWPSPKEISQYGNWN